MNAGWLIVMVFVTRTNWKNGFDKAVEETKAAQAAQKSAEAAYTDQKAKLEADTVRVAIALVAASPETQLA